MKHTCLCLLKDILSGCQQLWVILKDEITRLRGAPQTLHFHSYSYLGFEIFTFPAITRWTTLRKSTLHKEYFPGNLTHFQKSLYMICWNSWKFENKSNKSWTSGSIKIGNKIYGFILFQLNVRTVETCGLVTASIQHPAPVTLAEGYCHSKVGWLVGLCVCVVAIIEV